MAAGGKVKPSGGSLLLVLFTVFLVVFLILAAWRISLPWRLLSLAAGSEAQWDFSHDSLRAQPIRLSIGPLTLLSPVAVAESRWVDLVSGGSVNLLRLVKARIEYTAAPERFQEIDFSQWKQLLSPSSFPVDKIDVPEATLDLSIFPAPLDVSLSAIRNRAGALESTARVEGGGLFLEGFLRFGWDSLESGGSFEGTYEPYRQPFRFSFFDEEPFQSLLSSFRQLQFEGSFVLDESWKFRQGVRLITASQESANFDRTTITELAFSGATVFPDQSSRENRALLEGLLPDKTTLFCLEATRRSDGPIRLELSFNGDAIFLLEADTWSANTGARLIVAKTAEEVPGTLRKSKVGGLLFEPNDGNHGLLPVFLLPGVFGLEPESD